MSNWTVVTGFFLLPDKGSGYSIEKYKQESEFTLGLDLNLIIYCDQTLYDYILDKRSKYHNKTKIHLLKITDLPHSKYVDQIERNRREMYPLGYPDSRNTSWYFILTVSKFTMLKMAINEDPFNSTHFAWLDFKYSQSDAKENLIFEALKLNRELFSCCLIDYFPREIALKFPELFYRDGGPCTVAAGFFTAKKDIMLKICNLIDQEFLNIIEKKYGHSEQSLMYVLLLRYPELFDFYVGDYQYLLLNYVKPVNLDTTKNCLIPHILYYKDQEMYQAVIKKIQLI